MLNKKCSVILGAGEGKRMHSKKPKVMLEVLFKPMIKWVFDSVNTAGISEVCVVTGYAREYIENYFGETVSYAVQSEQKGTGHALMCAESFLNKIRWSKLFRFIK